MQISRKKHWKFLEDELKAETEAFNKKFSAKALFLLEESEEMYVGQFIKFNEGEMIMRFPNSRNLPRKGEYLYSMILPKELRDYHNWGTKTYSDLFKERYKGTDCVCVWTSNSDDSRFSLVGFRKVELEFQSFIEDNKGTGIILAFAPQRPPIDYIANLQKVVEDETSQKVSLILDDSYQENDWTPQLIKQDNVSSFVRTQLGFIDKMIIQGPPGTGKTSMIAELCNELCQEGHSILITALTNRALMEIAEKSSLQELLKQGRVGKTNMSIDEHKENKELVPLKQILPSPGHIVLSSYFITSGFAAELSCDSPFDYLIMDEASQALLAMFAAANKLGKKNLWVGDVHQLSPIVELNEDKINRLGYNRLINGLQLLTENSTSPIYQLMTVYRFGQRSADYTGLFYNGTLVAKESPFYSDLPSMDLLLSKKGGPALLLTDMPIGDSSPSFAIMLATYVVGKLLNDNKKKEIAVLTCLKNTTRSLQKAIIQNVGSHTNVLVDTVARIQGLTTDVTLFFVPNTSYIRTLDPHLFNVATSRAKEHTIIIADKNLLEYPTIKPAVRTYLEKLKSERYIYIPARNKSRKELTFRYLLE
jgi:DNA replication ATP-dependent helicase Dna2